MSEVINILPFERLLGMLRAHGFYTGVDTLMRLSKYWQILAQRDDWDLAKVKYQLAALLCKNAEDQKKLYEILDTYLPDLLLEVTPLSPGSTEIIPDLKPAKPSVEKPLFEPIAPSDFIPPKYIPTGLTGPILPVLEFPEDPLRPWNLPGMGPALIPLQEKVWTETSEWDVPATIRRTIQAGGIPQFCFKRRKRAPRYLSLIEQFNPRDHLAGFSAELMREINRRDLEAEFYFYEKTPARCWKNVRNLRSHVHLDYLKSEWEGARLLLIGSTTPYINQATGQPSNLALDLPDSWEEVALLDTASPLEWGAAELTLMELFPVVPLSVDGLSSLMSQWNATEFRPPVHWQTEEPQAIPPSLTPTSDRTRDDVVLDLYRYLGKDAFRWACATAVYPEIYFEMTGILHDEAMPPKSDLSEWEQNQVWHQALLLLSRLEWYRRGYLPEPMQDNLRKRLSNTDLGTVEQEIRRILEWSNNSVQSGSYAADERKEMFGWLAERLFRVLWIDDHPENNTRYQADWTKELGIVFRNAINMGQALTYLAEPFDLIISDIGREGETIAGVSTIEGLKSRSIFTPVVFFTNTRGMNLRRLLMDEGALEVTNMVSVLKNLLEERVRMKFAPTINEQEINSGGIGYMEIGKDFSVGGAEDEEVQQTANISKESPNEENARYQSILKKLGYLEGEVDGKFGPETRKAVQVFQKEQGMVADGVLGPQTKAALEKAQAGAKPVTEKTEIPENWRRLASGVCQIRLANGSMGNGFLAEDGYIYTANFILPGVEAVRSATATFTADSGVWSYSFGLDANDFQTGGPSEQGFSRAKPKEALKENYPMIMHLPFRLESPGTGAKVSLIYHLPDLNPPVYRLDCSVVNFSETEMTYEAETENGSAGTPVFMPDGRVVGIHLAKTDRPGVKRGILMKEVLKIIQNETSPIFIFHPEKIKAHPSGIITVNLLVRNFNDILSFQNSINWDSSVLQFISLENFNVKLTNFDETKFGTKNVDGGLLSVSWFEPKVKGVSLEYDTKLFDIKFRVVNSSNTSIVISNRPTSIEVINGAGYSIGLVHNSCNINELEDKANSTTELPAQRTIFISYALPDEKMFWNFEKHLERLKLKHELKIQSRRNFEMMKSMPPVQSFMEMADLILLLVSPAYLSSGEILKEEINPALALQESGGKTVIPVILQPCEWQKATFAYLQALPSGGRPVSDFSREERGWSEVVDELDGIIGRLGREEKEPPARKQARKK